MTAAYEDQRRYRERRRLKALAYLGNSCSKCETKTDLHFDHIDPQSKVLEISQAIIAAWSWERLRNELDKCQLLCTVHHLEKSVKEGSLGGKPWNKIDDPEHGTSAMYDRPRKCRCDVCRQWKRDYRQHLVDAKGMPL